MMHDVLFIEHNTICSGIVVMHFANENRRNSLKSFIFISSFPRQLESVLK